MKYVGYVPANQLPVKPGDYVTIRKGVMVRHRGVTRPAHRTFKIRINHILSGITRSGGDRAYQERHGRDSRDVNPTVVWAGSGGYWSEVDINDLPEAQ